MYERVVYISIVGGVSVLMFDVFSNLGQAASVLTLALRQPDLSTTLQSMLPALYINALLLPVFMLRCSSTSPPAFLPRSTLLIKVRA